MIRMNTIKDTRMVQITVVEEMILAVVTIFSLGDERRGGDGWCEIMIE